MRVLSEAELCAVIGLDQGALRAVRGAFLALAGGRVRMPPILRLDLPEVDGEMDVKTAAIAGLDAFCLKVSTGFFRNPARGLPSGGGLMAVFDAETGALRGLLLDNGYLTNLRTALAGAVAAEALARPDADTVAILGAGAQARLQAQALRLVRPLREVRVWARDPARAAACAADIARATGLKAVPRAEVRSACAGAGIVVTTTPATAPILTAGEVDPGTHVTAIGSDAEHKRELSDDLMRAADRVIVDDRAQSERLGELRALVALGVTLPRVTTLGAVLADPGLGRAGPDEITIADLSGTGAQDTAIAVEAMSRLAPRTQGKDPA
jgi:ornithine cyclodeaminase